MKLKTLALFGIAVASTAAAEPAVYDLGPSNARETAEAINRAVQALCSRPGGETNGVAGSCRAELLATGQLLVEAPAPAQAKIAEVLKAIAARGAAPTPRITLQYWVISGAPGKPDASDPALKPLNAVLQQLEKLHGELGFKVEDSLTLTTQSGTNASNNGRSFEVSESVRAAGDTVDADIRLKFTRMMPTALPQGGPTSVFVPSQSELSVSTAIRRGEYLVLGEGKFFNTPDQSGTLFYVVHWPEGQ
ncbi:MAG TPA: hypothetical protein VFX89_11705 [Gammaproteobacteria bacterium]|nr:hypothetical protein [Gammaproteobacteria bacterium]